MLLLRKLLWIDCSAALLAGLAVLSLSGWRGSLYALPRELLVAMGVVNLAYGAFSISLLGIAVIAWGVARLGRQ